MSAGLSAEQLAAVERRSGSVALSANAGSGKTRVLAERFVRTVCEDGVDPARILAITFTDKAAAELAGRIRGRLAETAGLEAARALDGGWVATFHSVATRILRAHAVRAGLSPAFVTLEEDETRDLRLRAFEGALATVMAAGGPEQVDVIAPYSADELRGMVVAVYDKLRTAGQTRPAIVVPRPPGTPDRGALVALGRSALAQIDGESGKTVERFRERIAELIDLIAGGEPPLRSLDPLGIDKPGRTKVLKEGAVDAFAFACGEYRDHLADAAERRVLAVIARLLDEYGGEYERLKGALEAVDFSDQLLLARDLLRDHDDLRARYRARFKAIMVDEFQDTNPLQVELLDLLGGERFVVGDVLQAIYAFRGAEVGIFRAEKELRQADGGALTLSDNYRSRPELLALVDRAFSAGHGPDHTPFSAYRESAGDAPRAELLLIDKKAAESWDDDDSDPLPGAAWRRAEARMVAARVRELVDAGESPGDIVVLLRAMTSGHIYEGALREQGLETVSAGGGYWGRTEVLDICAFLAVLANPADELALFAMLASPLCGLSSDGLAAVAAAAEPGRRWQALTEADGRLEPLGDRDGARLERCVAWLRDERGSISRRSLAASVEHAVAETGYDLHLLGLEGGERRLANVYKLIDLAGGYEERHGRDPRGFADYASAELAAAGRQGDAPVSDEHGRSVRLMSIHASKGLEFKVVVVADIAHGRAGDSGRIAVDGGEAAVYLRTLDGFGAVSPRLSRMREARKAAADAEERRLFHVAMTRAEERLILAASVDPKPRAGSPAAWIVPELVPDIETRIEAAGDLVREQVHVAGDPDGPLLALEIRSAPPQRPATAGSAATVTDEPDRTVDGDSPGPAGPPRPVRSTISYSSLGFFERCPYRFHLERELGLPADQDDPLLARIAAGAKPGGLEPRDRGTIVHRLLETALPTGKLPTLDAVRAMAQAASADVSEDAVAELVALASSALRSELVQRVAGAGSVRYEATFSLDVDGERAPLLNGVIDVIAIRGEDALVIDYKTDRVGAGDDLERLVLDRYLLQREIYGLAALLGGSETVEVAHLFLLRPDAPAIARYVRSDIDGLRARLAARCERLTAGPRPPTDTPGRFVCAGCPGRGTLCPVPVAQTER